MGGGAKVKYGRAPVFMIVAEAAETSIYRNTAVVQVATKEKTDVGIKQKSPTAALGIEYFVSSGCHLWNKQHN